MLERMCIKGNTPPLLLAMTICTTTLKINMVVSPEIGNQPTSKPSNTTLGHISKGCSIIPKGHFSTIFIAALFVIAWIWKQLRWPSTKHNRKKMWNMYTMVKNNILKFTCKWMKLKNHPEWGNPDPERCTWYLLTHDWMLAVNQRTMNPWHLRS